MHRFLFLNALKRIDPQQVADVAAIAVVVSLAWSTSLSSILIGLWILAMLRFLSRSRLQKSISDLRKTLATFAGGLPVLLWLVAVVGMVWADVSWPERLHGLGGFHRLLCIPVLLVQFSRSTQTRYVLVAYLISSTVLLILSWAFVLWPAMAWQTRFPGVPVKDYIAQSGEFVLCAFGSLHFALNEYKIKHYLTGLGLSGLALAFLANVFYVEASRTELIVIPVLLIVFGAQRFGVKGVYVAIVAGAAIASLVWFTSPYIRSRVIGVMQEIHRSENGDYRNSTAGDSQVSAAEHLSLLKRSLQITEKSPLIGHGTGSISERFRQSVIGQTGLNAIVSANPHNQIFAVAIQLGILGTVVLLAMWMSHFVLFWRAGPEGWIGALIVLQNIISSQFNSHLFDFTQGWTYVFGVGVIGGAAMQWKQSVCPTSPLVRQT